MHIFSFREGPSFHFIGVENARPQDMLHGILNLL